MSGSSFSRSDESMDSSLRMPNAIAWATLLAGGEPGIAFVEFSGHSIVKCVNLFRKIESADTLVSPLAERFEKFLKFTR